MFEKIPLKVFQYRLEKLYITESEEWRYLWKQDNILIILQAPLIFDCNNEHNYLALSV